MTNTALEASVSSSGKKETGHTWRQVKRLDQDWSDCKESFWRPLPQKGGRRLWLIDWSLLDSVSLKSNIVCTFGSYSSSPTTCTTGVPRVLSLVLFCLVLDARACISIFGTSDSKHYKWQSLWDEWPWLAFRTVIIIVINIARRQSIISLVRVGRVHQNRTHSETLSRVHQIFDKFFDSLWQKNFSW